MGTIGISTVLVVLMIFLSCRSGKEPAGVKSSTDGGQGMMAVSNMETPLQNGDSLPQVWSREQAQTGPDYFSLVVVFISKGEGTDPEARSVLEGFLSNYSHVSGKRPAYVMIPWGREGEVDCCFNLNELDVKEQGAFIESLKKAMSSRELIQVYENAKNRFKP